MAMTLLAYLTALAQADQPCPSNDDVAAAIKKSRSYVSRTLNSLEDAGAISRRGLSTHRVVTILATGLQTARRAPTKSARRPAPPPRCVVCGDQVEAKSGKYPRSCARPTCRAGIRLGTHGRDPTPWPVVTGPVPADFSPHNIAFRRTIRRDAGKPAVHGWGVSTVYE